MTVLQSDNSVNKHRCRHLHLLTATLLLLTALPAFCVDVTLTVLDAETEEPVSGATVKTKLYNENLEQTDDEFITDADGQCFFSVFPDKPLHFQFSVEAEEYLIQNAQWTNSPDHPNAKREGSVPEEYTIRLFKPDLTIGGTVNDEAGYPVEDAKISMNPSFFKGRESTIQNKIEIYTDSEGKWTCDKAFSKFPNMSIKISHPDYGTESAHFYEDNANDLEALKNLTYQTILYKGLMITGLVRDAAGNPIEGAKVAYNFEGKSYSYPRAHVNTDHDGFYSISGAMEGGMYLIAIAEGYAHETRKLNLTLENTEQDFTLKQGLALTGLVLDPEDNPATGAYISIEDVNERGQVHLWRGQVDEEGRFEWKSSPPEGGRVRVHCQNYMSADNLELLPRPSDHVIRLKKPLVITGEVYDADTRELIKEYKITPGTKYREYGNLHWNINRTREIKNSEGWYKFYFSYPSHEFQLRVEAEGYEVSESRAFKKDEGEVTCDFDLKKSDKKPKIFEGTIQEKYTNNPLAGVKITLYDTSLNKRMDIHPNWQLLQTNRYRKVSVETDENGRFHIEELSYEKAMMTIEKSGYARIFIRDVDLSLPFFQSLPKGASISGHLYNDSGTAQVRAAVHISLQVEYYLGMGSAVTDPKGYFIMKDLPAGKYQCTTILNSQQDKVHVAIVSEGQDYVVDWDAPGIATLVGSYIENNIPVADMIVSAYSIDEKMNAAGCRTKADGTYRLNLPFLGKHNIAFFKGDPTDSYIRPKSREIDIKPGLNRLDMITGSNISGQAVFIKNDEPVSNARFRAYKKEPYNEFHKLPWGNSRIEPFWKLNGEFSSDADGAFKVKATSQGEWLITYTAGSVGRVNEIIIPSKTVTLKDAEQEKTVLFRVPETTMLRLNMADRDSGDKLKDIEICCRNRDGFVISPYRKKVMAEGETRPKWELEYDEDDRLLFRQLPPGKYTMFSKSHDEYPVSHTEFEIPEPDEDGDEKNEFVDLTFELEKGGRIVFNLPDGYNPNAANRVYIAYYLGSPENNQPVLKTENGPVWGDSLGWSKENNNNKFFLPLQPGEYILQAVFREFSYYDINSGNRDLWTYTSTVTVEKGKDVEINVDLGPMKTE